MTSRVLIADDSLTIQKVIGITLANSGYELTECLNEADLFKKIHSNDFDLVLLDFNLSDSQSGYELAKKISKENSKAAIIIMLGTFDTIDESQFAANGITDKIVKPFESSKFIKKCRDILEGKRPETSIKNELHKNETISPSDDIDSWKVDGPQIHSRESTVEDLTIESGSIKSTLDPLSSEIEGWGFAPTHSIEEKFQKVFPPIIEESSEEVNIVDRLQSASNFVNETIELDDLDATDPSFEIPEDLNRKLLNEIEEDVTAEAFWAVDEVVPRKSEEQEDISNTNREDVTSDLTETINSFKEYSQVTHINEDAIVEKLKISMRPIIEEMVKEFCRQSAEKVAWEVIPDLAENLIRKEIKEISESVQH